jgi:hypothetical protein
MSIQPAPQKCPQCLQQNSETACQHAILLAENTRVQEPVAPSSGAEMRDRELPLHVTREADAAVHVEREVCDAEAESDSESDHDSNSDTSDETDCTDYTDHTDGTDIDDIDDTIDDSGNNDHERYDAYSDSSESQSSIEHPEGGLSSYPLSSFKDISIT